MDPSLVKDGPQFFPNVLKTKSFADRGVLFGDEPLAGGAFEQLNWVVVDPRKHILYIWEKDQDDFVEAARNLSATVVTNGSFNIYAGGGKYASSIRTGLATIVSTGFALPRVLRRALFDGPPPGTALGARVARELASDRRLQAEVERHMQRYYSSSTPDGYVYGTNEGISETTRSQPQQHFFGRRDGRQYENYAIAQGDPPLSGEFIGGLFRSVDVYRAADPFPDQSVGFGLWGLAPLADDATLREAGIEQAIAALRETEGSEELPPPTGVAICAFWWGPIPAVIDLFVQARVKDAVRIDGNSSILLGRGNEILVNETMIEPKRYYNRWGYQFQPG